MSASVLKQLVNQFGAVLLGNDLIGAGVLYENNLSPYDSPKVLTQESVLVPLYV